LLPKLVAIEEDCTEYLDNNYIEFPKMDEFQKQKTFMKYFFHKDDKPRSFIPIHVNSFVRYSIENLASSSRICPSFSNNIINSIYRLDSFVKISDIELDQELLMKLSQIQNNFLFGNRELVIDFIRDNPFLITYIYESYNKIGEYFTNADLYLDLFEDENDERLVITVISELSPKATYQTLKNFDNDWWLDKIIEIKDYLTIMVDFK